MWHDAQLYGKFGGGSIVVQEMDIESYGSRSEEPSGFAETAPGTRLSVSLTDVRRNVAVLHAGLSFSGDEGLGGGGAQEGY